MSVQFEMNPFTKKPYGTYALTLRQAAQDLPVSQAMPALIEAITNNTVTIVVGETGSGKTTQLPKEMLINEHIAPVLAGRKIALTQPRRLQAASVADRIAAETDTQLGGVIGVRYRGVDRTSRSTRLQICTDGTLVAAACGDPLLSEYGAIIVDEAHLHTVPTDLLLGLLKDIASKRSDGFRIIIMSATLDAQPLLAHFPDSVLQQVQGRAYPLTVRYFNERLGDEKHLVEIIMQSHLLLPEGDFLVFVSGTREMGLIVNEFGLIAAGTHALSGIGGTILCLPLHAKMSRKEQQYTLMTGPRFEPRVHTKTKRSIRKIIVATNIAETSITLAGVTHVFDTCAYKAKIWNPRNETWSLITLPVSKASSDQRVGRAGRTGPGSASRMIDALAYEELPEHSTPAILHCDMLSETLSISSMGRSPLDFPYMVAPPDETIVKALELLHLLGAIDGNGKITDAGRMVSRLPCSVYSAIALWESRRFNCTDQIISLVAIMEASELSTVLWSDSLRTADHNRCLEEVMQPFSHPSGDHLLLFNLYTAWRQARVQKTEAAFAKQNHINIGTLRAADRLRDQLLNIMLSTGEMRSLHPEDENYHILMLQALSAGYCLQVAKRMGNAWYSVRGNIRAELDSELLTIETNSDYVIYSELLMGGRKNNLKLVSALPFEYIIRSNPNYWKEVIGHAAPGKMNDDMVGIAAKMTGLSVADIRASMPTASTAFS